MSNDNTEKLSFFDPSEIDVLVGISEVMVNVDSRTVDYVTYDGTTETLGSYANNPEEITHAVTNVVLDSDNLSITTTQSATPITIALNDTPNAVEWPTVTGVGYHVGNGIFKTIDFEDDILLTESETAVTVTAPTPLPHTLAYSQTNFWLFQDRGLEIYVGNAIDVIKVLTHKEGDDRLTLENDTITVPPGTYYAEFWSGAYRCDRLLVKLQDIDNNVTLLQSVGSRSDDVLNARQAFGSGHFTVHRTTRIQLIQFHTLYNASQHYSYLHWTTPDVEDYSVRSEVMLWAVDLFKSESTNQVIFTTTNLAPEQLVYASGNVNPLLWANGAHQFFRNDWTSGPTLTPFYIIEYPTSKTVIGYQLVTTAKGITSAEASKTPTRWIFLGRNNLRLLSEFNVTVSSSSEATNSAADNVLLPIGPTSFWASQTLTTPQWLKISSQTPVSFNGYSIINQTTLNATASPKDWILQGSNDDVNWTDLHNVNNDADDRTGAVRYYYLSEPSEEYQYIRLLITAANGSQDFVAIARFQLHTLSDWETLHEVVDDRIGNNVKKYFNDLGPWNYTDYKFEFLASSAQTGNLTDVALSDVALFGPSIE